MEAFQRYVLNPAWGALNAAHLYLACLLELQQFAVTATTVQPAGMGCASSVSLQLATSFSQGVGGRRRSVRCTYGQRPCRRTFRGRIT